MAFPLHRERLLARANAGEGLGDAGRTEALLGIPRSAARVGGRARGRAPPHHQQGEGRSASPRKAAGQPIPMKSLRSKRSAKSLASLLLRAGAWVCPRARVGISRLMLSRLGHS